MNPPSKAGVGTPSRQQSLSAENSEVYQIFSSRLRKMLLVLVGLVILEGLIRKLFGIRVGNLVFIGKDALTALMAAMLLFFPFKASALKFQEAYGLFFFGMLVPFALTLGKDPVLAVFGFKQYVLFPVVAFAVRAAFRDASRSEVRKFFQWPVLLLVPVTALALYQLRLPSANWINESVGGSDMSGFAAAGHLRVSSTFPFVAQFAMYLNAMVYVLGAFFFVRRTQNKTSLYMTITLCGLLVLSSFVTGSRTAVLGNVAILAVTAGLLFLKGNSKSGALFIGTMLVGCVAYFAVRYYLPTAFQAYAARSGSTGIGVESQQNEIQGRFAQAAYKWMDGMEGAPPTLFGYGLGVMSNGSDRISSYAARWRHEGTWGEVDMANTLFEGGWYLVFIWMAFRLFTVLFVVRRVLTLHDPQLVTAGCLAAGYVVVEGTTGTLGIQPPLAIWFWLAVGTVMVLERLDKASETGNTGKVEAQRRKPNVGTQRLQH